MIKILHKLTDLRFVNKNMAIVFGSILLSFSGGSLYAQYKIDPRFDNLIRERNEKKLQKSSSEMIDDQVLPITSLISPDGTIQEYYQAIIYTKDAEKLKQQGYIIQSISDDFVTALLSENDFTKLRDDNNVSTVNFPQIYFLNNQSNVIESGATLLQNGALNNTNYTGKGILVGIYDTGIDFTHPDFIDPITKKTRIVSIWDQTLTPITGENSPQLYNSGNFGVEYTADHINDEIDGTPTNYIRQKDINSHGTHVAGTAAGNGAALEGTPHKGMAPEANLVIVKGGDGGFSETNTITSLDYFKSVAIAQGKPIVVNMSIGGQGSPHDGKSAQEIKVNEFSNSGQGRAVVIAAGNEGNGNIHQRIALASKEKKSFKIEIGENKVNNSASLFTFLSFNKGNKETSSITAKLTAPDGSVFTQKVGSDSLYFLKNKDGQNYQSLELSNYIDTSSGQRFIHLIAKRITTANTQGVYDLEIENNSDKTITVDGWLTTINSNLAQITLPEGDNNYTVGSPGTADDAITVANYLGSVSFAVNNTTNPSVNGTYNLTDSSFQKGALNPSSSKGPRIDEARKPDIAAGGTLVISARTKDFIDDRIIDGKYYSVKTGTSMASPAVAGGVALLLQANKHLTAKEIKQRLIENVNQDNFTTNVHTNEFGYGKLNIYKSVAAEVNKLNNNTTCPISVNYTLANDNLVYKFGAKSLGTEIVNYMNANVAVKLKSTASGKFGNITFYLGNYNSNIRAQIPLTVEVRKVNKEGKPGDLISSKIINNVKTLEQSGWNNLSFVDDNIKLAAGEEVFVVLSMKDAELSLFSDNINIDKTTYISTDNGKTYNVVDQFDAKVRAIVYENEPAVKQLATTTKSATQSVALGYNYFINGCEMITRVESSGVTPITGNTTAKTWIDSSLKDFVARRIEVNADNNNSTSTGKVTLFYTQSDFDQFNKNNSVQLPTSPTDEENKKNVIVHYFAGISKDNSGTPGSYENSVINTAINAENIVWNDTYKYWEITIDAIGFGGYLLSTNATLANIDNTLNLLTVYPNPVLNELSISLPTNVKDAKIRIVNVAGQNVIDTEIKQNNNKINVSHLAKGVYIIEIKTEKGVVTKKIIKK